MVDAGLTPAELITADLSPVFLFAQSISRRAVTSGRVLPLFKTNYVARRPRRYPRRGSGPGALLCEYGTLFASGEALFLNNRGRSRVHWAHETAQLNGIRPKSDPGHWKPPLYTLSSGTGDCKDYAIAKYVALIEAGVAAKDVRLVIVRDLALGQDHAVIAMRLGPNWIMLDNRWLTLLLDAKCVVWLPCLKLIMMVLGNLYEKNTSSRNTTP